MQHAHVRFLFFYWNGQNNQINDLPFSQMKQCIVSKIYSRDIRCLEVLWGGIWWFTGSQSDNVVDFLLRQWLQSKFGRNRGFRGAPNNNGRWRWGVEKITKLERSLIHYGRCPKWSPSQHGPNVKPWRERKSVARGEERVTAAPKLAAICLRRFFALKLFKNCFQHWVIEVITM